ncbi:hypothetical protein DXV75_08670 [Alteromonas aestuariivivens]|uniref:DUF493 domain-containing protein n=1 Tax=Alteromonas aestuariivivens TaxID=1938339 RepID=A0A3D8M8X7_9ALTE|nr:hypothetical protein [Alteromonas aestuariivivens]RDV26138.1 hypothetical protein DXV75_08670 [Alteromonas aestuariivivens]
MENQIEYQFPSEPQAYRFLNTVSHFDCEGLVVKYGQSSRHVKVKYRYAVGEFDGTLSKLDDLARELAGEEVS